MLKDTFFTIIDKKPIENNLVFEVKLHNDHPVYQGHFPDQPIAPGVCLGQMVKEICEVELESDLKMISSRNMKFMAILNPFENEKVLVSININEDNDEYSVKASCKTEDKVFFKIDSKYCKS